MKHYRQHIEGEWIEVPKPRNLRLISHLKFRPKIGSKFVPQINDLIKEILHATQVINIDVLSIEDAGELNVYKICTYKFHEGFQPLKTIKLLFNRVFTPKI